MIGIILVSHSRKITDGLKDMLLEMVGEKSQIISSGGMDDSSIGTDPTKILDNIHSLQDCEHILLFNEIGSSVLSSEMAIDLIDDETLKNKCVLMNAPLVEGAFVAAVQSMVSNDLNAIVAEVNKLSTQFITEL